ncbi:hypothetical protein ABZ869_01465 [Streptomyces sp. NPDC046928]|uniref:hypothetical protein n=1 Tax=Streptomyces sp. NPDC046928 TaxID=3155021 RepID=UPI003403FF75
MSTAPQTPTVGRPLTEAERTMLRYALEQAQEHIWSRDGFTDEDQAAVTSLRRLADEPAAVLPPPADRAAVLREAADELDARMERFFREWPDEPRNSPYALGQKDAAAELRGLADEAQQQECPVSLATVCTTCDHARNWHDTTRGICLLSTRPGEQCDCSGFTTKEQAETGEPAVDARQDGA